MPPNRAVGVVCACVDLAGAGWPAMHASVVMVTEESKLSYNYKQSKFWQFNWGSRGQLCVQEIRPYQIEMHS